MLSTTAALSAQTVALEPPGTVTVGSGFSVTLEGGQVIAAADEENGGVVEVEPGVQGRSAAHLGRSQSLDQQHGGAGFFPADGRIFW